MQEIFNNIIEQRNQQKSLNLSKSSNELKLNEINVNDNMFKWNFIELNFYDFNYNVKIFNNNNALIKHVEKNIYFRNIYLFVIWIKKIAMIKNN